MVNFLTPLPTGCLKKTALVEKRFKDRNVNIDYTEIAVFLIRGHHCDMGNEYLYLPGWFLGSSWVFSGHIMGISRILRDDFKSVSM